MDKEVTITELYEKFQQHAKSEEARFALLEKSQNNGWHLKKEVSMSVIISVLGVAVAGFTAYTDLKRDIALIQADALVLHRQGEQQQSGSAEALESVRSQYIRLDAKLDRLIERSK